MDCIFRNISRRHPKLDADILFGVGDGVQPYDPARYSGSYDGWSGLEPGQPAASVLHSGFIASGCQQCFTFWKETIDGAVDVLGQGCLKSSDGCEEEKCVSSNLAGGFGFCCCRGELCNREVAKLPANTVDDHRVFEGSSIGQPAELELICVLSVLLAVLIIGIVIVTYRLWKSCSGSRKDSGRSNSRLQLLSGGSGGAASDDLSEAFDPTEPPCKDLTGIKVDGRSHSSSYSHPNHHHHHHNRRNGGHHDHHHSMHRQGEDRDKRSRTNNGNSSSTACCCCRSQQRHQNHHHHHHHVSKHHQPKSGPCCRANGDALAMPALATGRQRRKSRRDRSQSDRLLLPAACHAAADASNHARCLSPSVASCDDALETIKDDDFYRHPFSVAGGRSSLSPSSSSSGYKYCRLDESSDETTGEDDNQSRFAGNPLSALPATAWVDCIAGQEAVGGRVHRPAGYSVHQNPPPIYGSGGSGSHGGAPTAGQPPFSLTPTVRAPPNVTLAYTFEGRCADGQVPPGANIGGGSNFANNIKSVLPEGILTSYNEKLFTQNIVFVIGQRSQVAAAEYDAPLPLLNATPATAAAEREAAAASATALLDSGSSITDSNSDSSEDESDPHSGHFADF